MRKNVKAVELINSIDRLANSVDIFRLYAPFQLNHYNLASPRILNTSYL